MAVALQDERPLIVTIVDDHILVQKDFRPVFDEDRSDVRVDLDVLRCRLGHVANLEDAAIAATTTFRLIKQVHLSVTFTFQGVDACLGAVCNLYVHVYHSLLVLYRD